MTSAKIAFPGFAAPAAGFEAPLEMLSACHGRVERQCQTLLRLVPHLAANGPDQAAREAAQNVMRYFDTSAPHHHTDEEEDLFPALLESAPESELASLRDLIDVLRAQHRELEQAWTQPRWKLEGVWLGTIRPGRRRSGAHGRALPQPYRARRRGAAARCGAHTRNSATSTASAARCGCDAA